MAKGPTLNGIVNILNSSTTINDNNDRIETAFENTLSRDGSTPNSMEADLDMNGNDLINLSGLEVETLRINGQLVADVNSFVPMWQGDWVTATAYNSYDLVKNSGTSYICLTGHTSGNFSTDLAGGLWEIFVEKGDSGSGSGDMLAANNLSDVADAETSRNNIGVEIGVTVQAYDANLTGTTSNLQSQIDAIVASAVTIPAGTVTMYAGATAPSGWLLCDGTAVNRTTYAALFAVIGETFGAGNGSTTFNLPDTTDRFPRGAGGDYAVGDTHNSANKAHTHTVSASGTTSSNGAHTHSQSPAFMTQAGSVFFGGTGGNMGTTSSTSSAGNHTHTVTVTGSADSDGGTEAMPKGLAFNYIIKT